MHELSIVSSTLDMAIEEAERQGARQILVLNMKVGALSGVVPDALTFAFECLSAGTMAEGARLEILPIPIQCTCQRCNKPFEPPDYICICPTCGTLSEQVDRGRELELASMEVRYDGQAD